jgi:hypothetical protein
MTIVSWNSPKCDGGTKKIKGLACIVRIDLQAVVASGMHRRREHDRNSKKIEPELGRYSWRWYHIVYAKAIAF